LYYLRILKRSSKREELQTNSAILQTNSAILQTNSAITTESWKTQFSVHRCLSQLCNYSAPTQMCKIYKRGTGGLALLKQVTHDCKWSVFSVFIICPSPPRKHFHIRLETNVAMNMRLEFSTREVQILVSVAKFVSTL
jgi:hypothetical protein